jgi:hypothetical protein
MSKLKTINKETASWALMDALDLPPETIGEIIEVVWNSDSLLEAHQAQAQNYPNLNNSPCETGEAGR